MTSSVIFATDFSLAHTVPHFPSHQGAWPELPVIALNIICILSKFHHTSIVYELATQETFFLLTKLGFMIFYKHFNTKLYHQTKVPALGLLFHARTNIFQIIMVQQTNFPGILVPRTEIFAGPKFPQQCCGGEGSEDWYDSAIHVSGFFWRFASSQRYLSISSLRTQSHSSTSLTRSVVTMTMVVSESR